MKKWLMVLCCVFLIPNVQAEKAISYEIDPLATTNAPWKVGERIIKEGSCMGADVYREFLGITQSGFALLQDFYLSGEKFSDPYLKTVINAERNVGKSCTNDLEGSFTFWYKNGQRLAEGNYEDGKLEGLSALWYENGQKQAEINFKNGNINGLVTWWYKNGQKRVERNMKNGERVGIWLEWDEKGDLIEEKDFGAPQ